MTTVIAKYSQFVMPDHINVVGTLFGGQMIAWVDLAAAKASYRFLKGSDVDGSVTRTIEQVEFKEPVYLGDWVNFTAKIVEAGTTSLKIEVKAHVKNIDFENTKATGLSYWKNNKLIKVKAKKEIILSAGSIGSPHILQTSGVGDPYKLKTHGINIVHGSLGVGKNLQDHLMMRPVYKVKNIKTLNKKINSIFGKILIGLEYALYRKGPMTMGASQLCGFAKSDSSRETPNLQFHIQPISTDRLGGASLHDFHAFTPTVANIRPTSRGTVSISSADTRDDPKIKMNYLSTPEDRKVTADGLKLIRKIVLETKSFAKYSPEEFRPGINIQDDEGLVKAASEYAQTIFHPVGTCKMGNDESAVVSDKLKVHGLNKLRVIDASIMPNITSGNTNAPTIMIAEKGADMILSS